MDLFQVIPTGDWFCAECRPPEPPPKISRRQRKEYLSDDEIADELEKSDEEEEGDEGDNEREGSKRSKAHMNIDNGPMDLEGSFLVDDAEVCEVCGFGGQVICCDKCPRLYHLQCLDPPKTRVPRGSWYCPHCSGSGGSGSKSGNKRKNKKKGKAGGKKKRVERRSSGSSDEDEDDDEESDIEETAEESQDTDDVCDDDDTNEENGHSLRK